jgi:hypothetical protein
VPRTDGQDASLSLAGSARADPAGSRRGDQSAVGLRRAGRGAVSAVAGAAVARPSFATRIARAPAPGHVVLPRLGLVFPRRLPFEAWLGVGAELSAVATSSAWCLGDWLVYGRAEYGGRYREAIGRTGLDYQTLRNYAWVAGRFELSRRRDTLSFGHHAELAALPGAEQDFWLRKAEEFGWSTMRLRREVRSSLAERAQEPAGPGPPGPAMPPEGMRGAGHVTLRIKLTSGQLESCDRAARSQGMTIQAWAIRALEQAAQASARCSAANPNDPHQPLLTRAGAPSVC